MRSIQCLVGLGMMMLVGCAHNMMRGSVAMKVSDNEAHVCMGNGEVKPGDKVALYRNVCVSPKAAAGGVGGCHKESLGQGEVERILNEHYSVVKVNPGVHFEEGTIVEKL